MSMPNSLPLVLLLLAGVAMAQSADQELVSVVAAPDPVVPGQNVTYTVTVRNNGPDAAVNGGINAALSGLLTPISHSAPAGFTCYVSGTNLSCLHPAFPSGSTAVISIVARLADAQVNFPDGTFTSNFAPSGTTIDPIPGNNLRSVTTAWDSPQIDLSVAVEDTPDPVGPDQFISYALHATHAGPDTATNVNVNVYNNGTLRFQSITAPAGFTCTPLAVGAAPILTCSKPLLTPGNYDFSVVVLADDAVLGLNDGTVQTAFGVTATGNEINQANNSETETTAYVTPDADLAIASIDLPDPVIVGQSLQYQVTMNHLGPDAAVDATLNMYNNGSLRFQQMLAPPGFVCTLPPVGAAPIFSCRIASMAAGSSADFVITVLTDVNLIGELGGVVSSSFGATANTEDPGNANNIEVESTLILADLLFRNGFEG